MEKQRRIHKLTAKERQRGEGEGGGRGNGGKREEGGREKKEKISQSRSAAFLCVSLNGRTRHRHKGI